MHRILNRSLIAAALCALSITSFAPLTFAADTPAEAQYRLGNDAVSAKHYAEAANYFSKAIQLDPNHWKAYANRSAARYNAGDYQGALADVKIALPHFPDNQSLKQIVGMCESKLNGGGENNDLAARREMARQMLLNAQLGGDMTDPGFQILMAARRKAGLNPITGMPLAQSVAAIQNASQNKVFADANATNSNSVTSKLEALSKGGHVLPQTPSKITTTATHTKTSSSVTSAPSSALEDSLASRVSSLPPPNFDNANDAPATTMTTAMTTTEAPSLPDPTPVPSTSGVSLMNSAAGGGRLVNTLPGQSQGTSLVSPLSNRNAKAAPQQNFSTGPRLSADNDARDPRTGMTAQNYFDRACGKDKVRDFQGALQDYDEAIKLNPNHGPAYCNRGSTRFNSGNHKGALEDFNMAAQLMPDNDAVRQLRDRVAAMVGQ